MNVPANLGGQATTAKMIITSVSPVHVSMEVVEISLMATNATVRQAGMAPTVTVSLRIVILVLVRTESVRT
jgi:hypothetical protein